MTSTAQPDATTPTTPDDSPIGWLAQRMRSEQLFADLHAARVRAGHANPDDYPHPQPTRPDGPTLAPPATPPAVRAHDLKRPLVSPTDEGNSMKNGDAIARIVAYRIAAMESTAATRRWATPTSSRQRVRRKWRLAALTRSRHTRTPPADPKTADGPPADLRARTTHSEGGGTD